MRISFKKISAIIFVAAIIYGLVWLAKLVWFRPDNIKYFFQRFPYQYAVSFPEEATQVSIPQAEFLYPYQHYLNEAGKGPDFWKGVHQTLTGYKRANLTPDLRYHYDNLLWVSGHYQRNPEAFERAFTWDPYQGIGARFFYLMEVLHQVEDQEGAEAYLSRMKRFGQAIRRFPAEGLVVQDSLSQEKTLRQIRRWSQAIPSESPLYKAFARKAIQADPTMLNEGEASRLLGEVAKSLESTIQPGLGMVEKKLVQNPTQAVLPSLVSKENYPTHVSFYSGITLSSLDSVFTLLQKELARRESDQAESQAEDSVSTSTVVPNLDSLHQIYQELKVLSSGIFELQSQAPLSIRYYEGPLLRPASYVFGLHSPKGEGTLLLDEGYAREKAPFGRVSVAYWGAPGIHHMKALSWQEGDQLIFRQFLPFSGFEHGWGLYVIHTLEEELLLFSRDRQALAEFQYLVKKALLLGILDILIHHKQESLQNCQDFLSAHTTWDHDLQLEYIQKVKYNPGYFCASWIGYEEFRKLRKDAQEAQGVDFILQDFHSQIIKIGPGTFPALRERMGME